MLLFVSRRICGYARLLKSVPRLLGLLLHTRSTTSKYLLEYEGGKVVEKEAQFGCLIFVYHTSILSPVATYHSKKTASPIELLRRKLLFCTKSTKLIFLHSPKVMSLSLCFVCLLGSTRLVILWRSIECWVCGLFVITGRSLTLIGQKSMVPFLVLTGPSSFDSPKMVSFFVYAFTFSYFLHNTLLLICCSSL